MKLKRFSSSLNDFHETTSGVVYVPAQVTSNYVLNPAENFIDYIEKSPINKLDSVNRKTRRFGPSIKSINNYIKYKLRKRYDNKKD